MITVYFRLNNGYIDELNICEDCFSNLNLDTIEEFYDYFTEYFISKYNDSGIRILESW